MSSLIETLIQDTPGIGEEVVIPIAGSKTIRATAGKPGDQTVLVDLVRIVDETDGKELYRVTEAQLSDNPVRATADIVDICAMTLMTDPEYGRERVVQAATGTGRTMRTDCLPDSLEAGGDYLRVVEEDSTEIGYWHSDEFAEDAQSAFAAVLATLGGNIVIRRAGQSI